MTTDNRLFDDFAKLLTNAAGAARGVGEEVETAIRQQAERVMGTLDFVPRDEFEAVKAIAQKAKKENVALARRVAALEELLNIGDDGKTAKTPPKARAKAGAAGTKRKTAASKKKRPAAKKAAKKAGLKSGS